MLWTSDNHMGVFFHSGLHFCEDKFYIFRLSMFFQDILSGSPFLFRILERECFSSKSSNHILINFNIELLSIKMAYSGLCTTKRQHRLFITERQSRVSLSLQKWHTLVPAAMFVFCQSLGWGLAWAGCQQLSETGVRRIQANFFWSTLGGKIEFLKTRIRAYAGFWNINMMCTNTKTRYFENLIITQTFKSTLMQCTDWLHRLKCVEGEKQEEKKGANRIKTWKIKKRIQEGL